MSLTMSNVGNRWATCGFPTTGWRPGRAVSGSHAQVFAMADDARALSNAALTGHRVRLSLATAESED